MGCSTPSGSTRRACCTTCSYGREMAGRIELALADTATYSKAAADGTHFVTLYNGRRYEGVPGQNDFRVIEFREHGIPVITPRKPSVPRRIPTPSRPASCGDRVPWSTSRSYNSERRVPSWRWC